MNTTVVKRVVLPMGDTYVVTRTGKKLLGYRVKKLTGERVPPFCNTYGMFIVDEYIAIARLCDMQCLEGTARFVTAEYAHWYRNQPVQCSYRVR